MITCGPVHIFLELAKFGPTARAQLFVQLHNFPTHYLVLVVADEDFKYALISVKVIMDSANRTMVMDEIGWLDVARIRGNQIRVHPGQMEDRGELGAKRKAVGGDLMDRYGNLKHEVGRCVVFGDE